MNIGTSDLSSLMGLRAHQARAKSDLANAAQELSTGQKTDLLKATGGDLGKLFAIDNRLSQLSTDTETLKLASGKAGLAQLSLGNIGDSLTTYGADLLSALGREDQNSQTIYANNARNKLEAAVSALNVRYGRHSIFAGAAVDQRPISSSDEIVNDVAGLISGAPDPATAIAAIDDYFYTAGGGFETNIYGGANIDAPEALIDEGTSLKYGVRADQTEIRDSLRAFAIAAAVTQNPGLTPADRESYLRESAESAMRAKDAIIRVREDLGYAEEAIGNAQARNAAMINVFQLERNGIAQADPYEAATQLQAMQGQLETVYTLTARLANLSFTNFMR